MTEYFAQKIRDIELQELNSDINSSSPDDIVPLVRMKARRRLLIELQSDLLGG